MVYMIIVYILNIAQSHVCAYVWMTWDKIVKEKYSAVFNSAVADKNRRIAEIKTPQKLPAIRYTVRSDYENWVNNSLYYRNEVYREQQATDSHEASPLRRAAVWVYAVRQEIPHEKWIEQPHSECPYWNQTIPLRLLWQKVYSRGQA